MGLDVFERWRDLGLLKGITQDFELNVALSSESIHEIQKANSFKKLPNIKFIQINYPEVRSIEVNRQIINSGGLKQFLPEHVVHYLKNEINLEQTIKRYINELHNYAREVVQKKLVPKLDHPSYVKAEIIDVLKQHPQFENILLFLDPGNLKEVSMVVDELQNILYQSKTNLDFSHFTTNMFLELSDLKVREMYDAHFDYPREVIKEYRELTKVSNKSIHWAKKVFWLILWNGYKVVFKAARGLGMKKMSFINSNIPGIEINPIYQLTDREFIVYRGISPKVDIKHLSPIWEKEGFISKTALTHRLNGDSLELAVPS